MTCISSQRNVHGKIGFLGAVIGPNGIEMEGEKVDKVMVYLL